MTTHLHAQCARGALWRGFVVLSVFIRFAFGQEATPELRMANIFADGMVLQQQKPITIWGWARYGWENQPNANAYGLRGLPVFPFRTDDWPLIRALPKWAPDLAEREKINEETGRRHEAWRRERKIEEARNVLRDLQAD